MGQILTRDHRRGFLSTLTLGAAAFATRGLFADELVRTPKQTEGPFYPDKLPLDTDNDLLVINDTITPAVGEVTHLTGRILDAKGQPGAECPGRNLAGRQQRLIYPLQRSPSQRKRQAFPGLRPVLDRVDR